MTQDESITGNIKSKNFLKKEIDENENKNGNI